MELSERTLAAIAALIGAAMFALISDMAARSGSSSPAIALSSSRESCLYSSCFFLPIWSLLCLRRLRDVARLLGVRVGDGVVAQDVQCSSEVDRGRHVRIDQRHRS